MQPFPADELLQLSGFTIKNSSEGQEKVLLDGVSNESATVDFFPLSLHDRLTGRKYFNVILPEWRKRVIFWVCTPKKYGILQTEFIFFFFFCDVSMSRSNYTYGIKSVKPTQTHHVIQIFLTQQLKLNITKAVYLKINITQPYVAGNSTKMIKYISRSFKMMAMAVTG